ncbi:PREDICTED: protein FAM229A [Colobus angolensis palliatus]|uniref:protein FAM229A n=1 Tax=Colobus angolensis palliatus TaxID=336983 RepID=UPI0005F4B8FA|nr:PREDICTED: protein FAM229A [Colobus angolensis palliatus]
MLPSSTPGSGHAAETCPAPPGPERSPAASARAAASSLGPVSASGSPRPRPRSHLAPPAVRSPHSRPDPRGPRCTPWMCPTGWAGPPPQRPLSRPAFPRPLRRCPGCHCLTLLHVPIDVYLAMGGSPRARAT